MFNSKKILKKLRVYKKYWIFISYWWLAVHLKGLVWEKVKKRKENISTVNKKNMENLIFWLFRKKVNFIKKKRKENKTWIQPKLRDPKTFLVKVGLFMFVWIQKKVVAYGFSVLSFFYTILYDFISEFILFYFYEASTWLFLVYVPHQWNIWIIVTFGDHYWFFWGKFVDLYIKLFHLFKNTRIHYKRLTHKIYMYFRRLRGWGAINRIVCLFY